MKIRQVFMSGLNFFFGIFLSIFYVILTFLLFGFINVGYPYSLICVITMAGFLSVRLWKDNKMFVIGFISGISGSVWLIKVAGEMAVVNCLGGVCI